ncbi:MFS transporter [Curtobacterium flaccumfaciens]|nr:MFS transporter [Curtobacterium flaccumfaciens]
MPESPVRKPGRLDMAGTFVLAVSLVAILLAVSEGETWGWGDAKTIGLLVLGAVALVVFVLVELRVAEPLIDVRLFAVRGVWTAHVVALVFGFAMFGTFVLVPTLLQLPTALGYGFGKDVTQAGLFLLPTVVMMVVAGPIAGVLVRKVGPKPPMLIGGFAIVAAFVLPAIAHAELWQVVASGVLTGIGIGMALAACSNAIIESVPAEPDRRGHQRQHGRPHHRLERRHRRHRRAHHLAQHAAGSADRRRLHDRVLGVHRGRGRGRARSTRRPVDACPPRSGRRPRDRRPRGGHRVARWTRPPRQARPASSTRGGPPRPLHNLGTHRTHARRRDDHRVGRVLSGDADRRARTGDPHEQHRPRRHHRTRPAVVPRHRDRRTRAEGPRAGAARGT